LIFILIEITGSTDSLHYNLIAKETQLAARFTSIDHVMSKLADVQYIAERSLATVLFLADRLEKPVFLEGEPGVGKTEVAIVLAKMFQTELIRLQCYEGLDVNTSLYEWNYPKQLLHIRMEEQGDKNREEIEQVIYSPKFLIKRPLLEAILQPAGNTTVLLIDELDRSDEEFEAFLLEILSDFQVTIPEIGTLAAKTKPLVVITSNRTRDIHDALKRRCLYHWIEYPSFEKEYRIITTRLPGIEGRFAEQITGFMQKLRTADFLKKPGISETLDWSQALLAMHKDHLDEEIVMETLGCILKYQEDIQKFKEEIWADHDQRSEFI
jgi:MoxR-like ATPase